MISSWEVYLFTRLDGINFLCASLLFAGIVLLICFGIRYACEEYDSEPDDHKGKINSKKWIRRAWIMVIVGLSVGLTVPSTKEAAVIYLLPKIANNEQVQKVPENFVKLLNSKMEEWIAGFEEKKEKK